MRTRTPSRRATAAVTPARRRNRILLAMALGAGVVVGISTTSSASHDFPDVPESNPFHDDISWMAATGITTGYEDGTFRPTDPVSRQSMSAFMQRSYNVRDDVAVDTAPDTAVTVQTFTTIPGLSAQVTVPAGTTATVIARYGAESHCEDDDDLGWCSVRIMMDGAEMTPVTGTNLAFDTPTVGVANDWWEARMIERYNVSVPAGSHTVTVQATEAIGGVDTFSLGDMTLVVQAVLDPAL